MLLLILLFTSFSVPLQAHQNDLCSIGRSGFILNGNILNGNWSYQGPDPINSNHSYWHSNGYITAIAWGDWCGWSNRYILKAKSNCGIYGYCGSTWTDPWDCNGNWRIWDGNSYALDTSWSVKNCTEYIITNNNDSLCNDITYLASLGISSYPATETYCIINGTLRTDFNGVYTYQGCNVGTPYYKHSETGGYIYWHWYFGYWCIGGTVGSYVISGNCPCCDFTENCNKNLYGYSGGSFISDSTAIVQSDMCSLAPTVTPSMVPSGEPTQPTVIPTVQPSGPSNEPSNQPSSQPTSGESIISTSYVLSSSSVGNSQIMNGTSGDSNITDISGEIGSNNNNSKGKDNDIDLFFISIDIETLIIIVSIIAILFIAMIICFRSKQCKILAKTMKKGNNNKPGHITIDSKVMSVDSIGSNSPSVGSVPDVLFNNVTWPQDTQQQTTSKMPQIQMHTNYQTNDTNNTHTNGEIINNDKNESDSDSSNSLKSDQLYNNNYNNNNNHPAIASAGSMGSISSVHSHNSHNTHINHSSNQQIGQTRSRTKKKTKDKTFYNNNSNKSGRGGRGGRGGRPAPPPPPRPKNNGNNGDIGGIGSGVHKDSLGASRVKIKRHEIEGLEQANSNFVGNEHWLEWTVNDTVKWIEEILILDNYDKTEINNFIENTFKKLNITGKTLKKLKTNQQFWERFQTKLENASFGLSITVCHAIQEL